MPSPATSRLAWIDWMRGLACVLMFQTHCYDSWLGGEARKSTFLMYSQLGGTLPAPLFLFLAGISFALVTDKLIRKYLTVETGLAPSPRLENRGRGKPRLYDSVSSKRSDVILSAARTSRSEVLAESKDPYPLPRSGDVRSLSRPGPASIARNITLPMFRRGAEIFAFGLLFRLQEYLISWGWAPWTDLFRVDILNMIGLSMMLMALVCGIALRVASPQRQRLSLVAASAFTAAFISLLTPPLWTNWRPSVLPWPIESYINGVHNLGVPQAWLFPMFPWMAFAFAGLGAGFVLFSDWGRTHATKLLVIFGIAGVAFIAISRWFDHSSAQLYSVYDYWHTSPNFFLMRVGILLGIAFGSYAWCRWGLGTRGFSPLIQLGQTSLLVYWVHIEFVYGRFSILSKRSCGIRTASLGLLTIFLMMLALSLLRTRVDWKAAVTSLRTWRPRSRRLEPRSGEPT